METMFQKNLTLNFTIVIILATCFMKCYSKELSNALLNLYELKSVDKIKSSDILENHPAQGQSLCSSLCFQISECVGFGIDKESCYLLKSSAGEQTCGEDCVDSTGMKIFVRKNMQSTVTKTENNTTNQLSTTAKKPTPTKKPCEPAEKNSVLDGVAINTKFGVDGNIEYLYHCNGNQSLYRYYTDREITGRPPEMVKCNDPNSGATVMIINYQKGKILSYFIRCQRLFKDLIDDGSGIIKKTSAPANKNVRCEEYQILVAFQAIEQVDGSYEVILECLQLLPK